MAGIKVIIEYQTIAWTWQQISNIILVIYGNFERIYTKTIYNFYVLNFSWFDERYISTDIEVQYFNSLYRESNHRLP